MTGFPLFTFHKKYSSMSIIINTLTGGSIVMITENWGSDCFNFEVIAKPPLLVLKELLTD